MNQYRGHESIDAIFGSARMCMDKKTCLADLSCKAVCGGRGSGLRGIRGGLGPRRPTIEGHVIVYRFSWLLMTYMSEKTSARSQSVLTF